MVRKLTLCYILIADFSQGLLPGPTIEARAGDTLVISVENHLEDEVLSFHWHGIHIKSMSSHANS